MSWRDTLFGALRAMIPPTPPTGAPRPAQDALGAALRADGWQSTSGGLGRAGFDRTRDVDFGRTLVLTTATLEALYREHAIARKIVDVPIEDALRPGYTVQVDNAEDAALEEALVAAAESIPVYDGAFAPPRGASAALLAGQAAADLYGGAVLVGLFDDGQTPDQPLAPGSYRALEGLVVLDRYSVTAMRPPSGRAEASAWMIGSTTRAGRSGILVHPSRVIPLMGSRLTPTLHAQTQGWGDSRLHRVFETLSRDGTIEQTVGHLVQEAVVGKYTIPGLKNMIASAGLEQVRGWMRAQHLARSAFNAVLIDADGGSYAADTLDFSGCVAVLEAMPTRVSAAAEIPEMLLYGKSAPGLNANGEADLRGYYRTVDGRYRGAAGKLTGPLRQILDWVQGAVSGPTAGAPVPYTLVWRPLYTLDPGEEADVRLKTAQADALYIQAGVVTPDEVAASRFGGRAWSAETALDVGLREAFAAAQAAEVETPTGLDPLQQIQQARLALPLLNDPFLGAWGRSLVGAPPMTAAERAELLELQRAQPSGGGAPRPAPRDAADAFTEATWRADAETGPGTHVALMLRLPPALASQRPELPDDPSPPHITLLRLGPVLGREADVLGVVQNICARLPTGPRADLRAVDYWTGRSGGGVIWQHVDLCDPRPREQRQHEVAPSDLYGARHMILAALVALGLTPLDDPEGWWCPHLTLAYLPTRDAVWTGAPVQGSWYVDAVEVWGLPEVLTIPLGSGV